MMTKELLLNDVTKWRFWGRWKMSIFCNCPYNYFVHNKIYAEFNLPKEYTGTVLNTDGYVYALESDHTAFNLFINKKFNEDLSWFNNFFSVCQKIHNRANTTSSNLNIIDCMNSFNEIACSTMIIHFIDKSLEQVVSTLSEKSGINSSQFMKLLVPSRPTYVMEYKEELYNLKDDKHDEFIKKYGWLAASFLDGERLTENDLKKELNGLKQSIETVISDTELMDSFDPKLKEQVGILQNLIYFRSANAEVANKVVNAHWDEIDELSNKFNLTRKDFNLLTPNEIISLASGESLPSDFSNRSDKYGIYCIDGDFKIFFEKELDEALKIFEQKVVENVTEVKGSIAFKGKVRGIARIIDNVGDLPKVMDGDIIIASETMPDYIIGMKKAAGFVTNTGGITSHAAIVAREMKKPCIIGTRNATKVFKDGDMVEVDAEKGVVRIIK